jgi:hypothetical protein
MINWPVPTFIGELYTSPNGDTWEWNGKAWLGSDIPGAAIGPTGPSGLTAWANILAIGNNSGPNNIIMEASIISGTSLALNLQSDNQINLQINDGTQFANLLMNSTPGLIELNMVDGINTSLMDIATSGISFGYADGSLTYNNNISIDNSNIILDATNNFGIEQAKILLNPSNFLSLSHIQGGNTTDLILQNGAWAVQCTNNSTYNNYISNDPNGVYLSHADFITTKTTEFRIQGDGLKHSTGTVGQPAIYDLATVVTTDNLPARIFQIDLSANSQNVVTFDVIITALDQLGTQSYGSKLFGTFRYNSSVLTQIGTIDKTEKSDFATASSNLVILGTDIIIEVTGEIGKTMSWYARFNYQSAI